MVHLVAMSLAQAPRKKPTVLTKSDRFRSPKLPLAKHSEDQGEGHTETHAGSHQPQHVDHVEGFEPLIASNIHECDQAKDDENSGLGLLHKL